VQFQGLCVVANLTGLELTGLDNCCKCNYVVHWVQLFNFCCNDWGQSL